MALAKKLKKTEPYLFYLDFWPGKQAIHIKAFSAIEAISIKALRLLHKDFCFDPKSFGFLLLFFITVGKFFINWSGIAILSYSNLFSCQYCFAKG